MRTGANRLTKTWLRAAIVLTVFVYAVLSVGVLKATHFCMGREASVTIFAADAKKCACSLFMSEADGCCHDEREVIALQEDQTTIAAIDLPQPELFFLRTVLSAGVNEIQWLATAGEYPPAPESPPKLPLYHFHCSLVFYDDRPLWT